MTIAFAPLTDPKDTRAYWRSARERACYAVWGQNTPPSFLPDTIELNWDAGYIPTGASHMHRYTITNPGGRTGGSVAYGHLLTPTIAPVGKLLVWLAGHSTTGWSNYYGQDDGTSILTRMLARGWHVLGFDLPNYGYNPTQAVVINGSLVTQTKNTNHAPKGSTAPFDGPPIIRLTLDPIIACFNRVTTDFTFTTIALAGQSGGGSTATLVASVMDRPNIVHYIQFGQPSITTDDASEWEQTSINELRAAATNGTIGDTALLGASAANRITVMHAADADEYVGDKHLAWEAITARWAPMIAREFNGSLSFYRKTTGAHGIDATQAAWIETHLATYG